MLKKIIKNSSMLLAVMCYATISLEAMSDNQEEQIATVRRIGEPSPEDQQKTQEVEQAIKIAQIAARTQAKKRKKIPSSFISADQPLDNPNDSSDESNSTEELSDRSDNSAQDEESLENNPTKKHWKLPHILMTGALVIALSAVLYTIFSDTSPEQQIG